MCYRTLALGLVAFASISALVALSAARDSALAAPAYNPVAGFCIEQFESQAECDGDPTPGGSPDLRTKFCIGWGAFESNLCSFPPDNSTYKESNSGGLVGFIPSNFTLVPGAPIGSIGGVLTSTEQFGLINGPCGIKINVKFTLLNASVDPNNTIDPKVVGERDVMQDLARDADGNGIPDGVDKYPTFLRNHFDPDWQPGPDGRPNYSGELSDDVFGPIAPVAPIARIGGFTKIEGGWVSLQFLMFRPGDLLPFAGDDVQLRGDLGFPLVTVRDDPTVPSSPGVINDFCAPLRFETLNFGLTRDNPCTGLDTGATRGNCPSEFDTALFNSGYPLFPCDPNGNIDDDQDGVVNDGCPQVNSVPESGAQCTNNISDDPEDSTVNDGCPQVGDKSEGGFIGGACSGNDEGGCLRFRLPPEAGPTFISIVTASQRDADGDGIENTLDTCSLKANPEWIPRIFDSANDTDGDGLPNVCDPLPFTPSPGSPLGAGNPNRSCFDTGLVGPDEDQDCYSNRQDNCPLHDQQDLGASAGDSSDNRPLQTDLDEDGIGDACDVTDCNAPPPAAYKGDPGQYQALCTLFGTSAGPNVPDGDRAVLCLTGTLAIGSPPSLSVAVPNTDPSCYLDLATATPTSSPTPEPTPSSPPLPPGFHDARAARLSASRSVNLSGNSTGRITFTVVNDGNHFESIGVYLDIIPPADGNCLPAGRLSQTVLNLNPGDRRTLTVDGYPGDPVPGDGKVTFGCAQPLAAEGQNYALILAVDAHADDLASCPPNKLISASCLADRNDDDADGTDNTRIRTSPTVVIH